MSSPTVRFIKTNLDGILVMGSLLSIRGEGITSEVDEAVLAAFQRYSPDTQGLSSVQNYLSGLSGDQIVGVVSNVKGILHEMEFVKMENSDGDTISAVIFPTTNHKGFDAVISDAGTGEIWPIQLKTTDDQEYVQEWVDKYPDGEILVSEEIASELGLESSGFSNQELTVRVEDFVDGLIAQGAGSPLWSLFPTLVLISVSFVLIELHRRYRAGKITKAQLTAMAVAATGLKATKIGALMMLLHIPVVNVVVGAVLVSGMLYSLLMLGSSVDPRAVLNTSRELFYRRPLARLMAARPA